MVGVGGNMKIKLSKSQWEQIGRTAGWMKKSQNMMGYDAWLEKPYQDEMRAIDEEEYFGTPVKTEDVKTDVKIAISNLSVTIRFSDSRFESCTFPVSDAFAKLDAKDPEWKQSFVANSTGDVYVTNGKARITIAEYPDRDGGTETRVDDISINMDNDYLDFLEIYPDDIEKSCKFN